jgi:L-iditol 2-dehydrogenase
MAWRDEPDPVARPGEVLVRVEAVGICGSDMHAFHGMDERRPAPLILGHEAAGRVISGPRAGTRVTIDPLVTCGQCEVCRDGRSHLCKQRQIISMPPRAGAFAEIVPIPEINIVPIPDHLSTIHAALAEPLAVSWHAVRRAVRASHRPIEDCRCLVIGGGAVGLGAALVLLHFGAKSVHLAEPNDRRRQTAAAANSKLTTFAPGDAREPADNTLDVIIDAVGADATRTSASRKIVPGGVIVHIGLLPGNGGIDVRKLTLQEVTLTGSYCYTHQDFVEVVEALAAGHFGQISWMEERPLSDGADAFRDLEGGVVAAAKIVLTA